MLQRKLLRMTTVPRVTMVAAGTTARIVVE
jgi:hypothetical protein